MTLAVPGCASGEETQAKDVLCHAAPASAEGRALHRVLSAAEEIRTTISKDDEKFVESMKQWLEPGGAEKSALPLEVCSFRPKKTTGAHRVSIQFDWLPRDEAGSKSRELPGKLRHYDVNGAAVVANDIISKLTVPCRMPGDLKKPSQKVLLQGRLPTPCSWGPMSTRRRWTNRSPSSTS